MIYIGRKEVEREHHKEVEREHHKEVEQKSTKVSIKIKYT